MALPFLHKAPRRFAPGAKRIAKRHRCGPLRAEKMTQIAGALASRADVAELNATARRVRSAKKPRGQNQGSRGRCGDGLAQKATPGGGSGMEHDEGKPLEADEAVGASETGGWAK